MEGNGGCCIARYAGGAYDNAKIDRIMLRFRPIAPKPTVNGSVSFSPDSNAAFLKAGRTKRKYVKDSNKKSNNSCRKKRVVQEEKENSDELNMKKTVVTLPLLPEIPVLQDAQKFTSSALLQSSDQALVTKPMMIVPPMWGNRIKGCDPTLVTPQPVRPVGSCVIAERLTVTCTEMVLGRTDEEKKMSLEKDTCPGFISDCLNRVRWTNMAYRKMVNQDGGEEGRPEMTWLVMRERLSPTEMCHAFACRVRVQYTCRKERNTLTVPCDVWKMDGEGFAWRLDVKAALSLGR